MLATNAIIEVHNVAISLSTSALILASARMPAMNVTIDVHQAAL